MHYIVEHWRGLGSDSNRICSYVRLADTLLKEQKFPWNHQTSQHTKSVAKTAGGLDNVKPKTAVKQRSNAPHLTDRPNFNNAFFACRFVEVFCS
jgi:hypothetical protein